MAPSLKAPMILSSKPNLPCKLFGSKPDGTVTERPYDRAVLQNHCWGGSALGIPMDFAVTGNTVNNGGVGAFR